MANKWNAIDIEKISTAFTQKSIETCFQDNLKISGDEIVNLSEFPQINYFVLREIFNQWEAETAKFESAYFDFENPEVQKCFQDFKNILSRNIAVGKEDFAALLKIATEKTLQLWTNPEAFFIGDFRDLPDFKLTPEWVKKNSVFFKSYSEVVNSLNNFFAEGESWVYANQALDFVKEYLKEVKEDYTKEIEAIETIAGIVVEEPVVETPNVEENLSFFDRLVANPPKPQEHVEVEEVSAFDRILGRVKKSPVEVKEKVKEAEVEPVAEKVNVPHVPVVETNTSTSASGLTLNDRFNGLEGNTLADLHQRSKITSLKGSMTLNQRFGFMSNLFNGNLEEFEKALFETESYSDFESAQANLINQYGTKYHWNLESEEWKDFQSLLLRRF